MADELIRAIWQGPYAAELPDMSVIYPGEEHLVTSEDIKSDHWQAVDEPPQSTPAASSFTSSLGSTAAVAGEDDEAGS